MRRSWVTLRMLKQINLAVSDFNCVNMETYGIIAAVDDC
uniref:Uncharacterized protein n=1 Tax=Cucumis melo TaxID=3656 RepID=A0A9I9EKW9_CUCME